ncbi:hypothetical protein [Ramlibacter sp. WS9]|uniref:hypothetical protein n=1 Tax=Ramlibacter sp. WS9 TaxID=1882741 RepID=UPI001141978E|nr:hypothetical protein [Ramlibacter sp. WS9]ROZ61449.1 hypothetical protein EEB15_32700 [Ramlibacter sp. WS9]
MVVAFITACIAVPVVWHWFDFDRARSSAGSALVLGVGCGIFTLAQQGWGIGILFFFLAAFFEFAVAFVVGLVYLSFASAKRSEYADRVNSIPLAGRRIGLGGAGAVAISLVIAFLWVAESARTGVWPWAPKFVLGWCAFFGLGVFGIARGFMRRSQEPK